MSAPGLLYGYAADLKEGLGPEIKRLAIEESKAAARTDPNAAFLAADEDGALFALDGEVLVAFAVLRPWEERSEMWLGMAWTHPDYRRKGIYRHLFGLAVEMGRKGGNKTLGLGIDPRNQLSIDVHLALGAKPVFLEVLL